MTKKLPIPKPLLVLLYILFLFVLLEGTARLVLSIPRVSDGLWAGDGLSWRRSWVERHKNTGSEIFYRFDIHDPYKGWASKANLRNVEVFHDELLNTNSRGIRGTTEHSYTKDERKTRILVLGDSFSFGDGVSDNETYSYFLQEMTPQAEVLNLGVHGYGQDQMLIYLEQEGIKYEPDIVVLGFVAMDMSRNLLDFRDYAKPKYVYSHNELRLTGVPVPPPEDILKWDWIRPRIVDVLSNVRHRLRQRSGSHAVYRRNLTRAILAGIKETAENAGALPIFVYLPTGTEISIDSVPTPGEKYFFGLCQTIGGVECFSSRPNFSKMMMRGVKFKTQGHWGPSGHRAVAEALREYLEEHGHAARSGVSHTPTPRSASR